jgi:hypothetical protein
MSPNFLDEILDGPWRIDADGTGAVISLILSSWPTHSIKE